MPTSTITWLVLAREVPPTIRVRGVERLSAALVLDVDTGLVRGIAIEETPEAALGQAFTEALNKPAGGLPAGPPDRVLHAPALGEPVRTALAGTSLPTAPSISEVQPGAEAEDIFDSFLGHLAGRVQPEELPGPGDWAVLIEQAAAFRRAEPWSRWSDEHDLHIRLGHANGSTQYTAVVMGNAGVQCGLVLYPGDEAPPWLREHRAPEDAPAPPSGTLLFTLDPPEEPPVEFTAKALRYGWPTADELIPVFMALTTTGAAEISQADARQLTAGIAAVLTLDARGPTRADLAALPVSGSIQLADQQSVDFEIGHRPPADEPLSPALRVHLAGDDLLPTGTPVTVGHLSWQALPSLRTAARVHRPAPADAPEPAGQELPLVVISPEPHHGASLAARIAELDPYGVAAVDTDDGSSLVVLAGGNGAEVLMRLPTNSPALAAFARRSRQTKGRHVVMIADAATSSGDGTVYGLFECHQPPPPARPAKKRR